MGPEQQNSSKRDLRWRAWLFAVVFIVPPVLAGVGAPKVLWAGIALIACVPLTFLIMRNAKREGEKLLSWSMTKVEQRAAEGRVSRPAPTSKERAFAAAISSLVAVAAMLLVHANDAEARWYFIIAGAWAASMAVACFTGRPSRDRDTKG